MLSQERKNLVRASWNRLRDFAWQFDPIGIADDRPSIEAEYDCLIELAVGHIDAGSDASETATALMSYVVDHMGIEADPTSARRFADSVYSWWTAEIVADRS